MKKQISIVIAVIIIAVLGFVVWNNKTSAPASNIQSEQGSASEQVAVTQEDAKMQDQIATSEETKPSAATYSMSDVSKHNTPADCWTTVDNNVYNLTASISKHPGGEKAIIGLCGVDGTAAFSKQHGSNEKAKSVLASLLIGTLTN